MVNAVPADINRIGALALSLFKGLATAGFISLVVYCFVRIMSSVVDDLRARPLRPFFLAVLARLRREVDDVRTAAPRSYAPKAMTASPSDVESTEAIVNPSLAEKEKNRAASRAVAFIVLLNGLAAIAILISLTQGNFRAQNVSRFADAMMVFGVGAAGGLASALFAYLRGALNIEVLLAGRWRTPLPGLAIAGAIIGTVCFLVGLNMARIAVQAKHLTSSPGLHQPLGGTS